MKFDAIELAIMAEAALIAMTTLKQIFNNKNNINKDLKQSLIGSSGGTKINKSIPNSIQKIKELNVSEERKTQIKRAFIDKLVQNSLRYLTNKQMFVVTDEMRADAKKKLKDQLMSYFSNADDKSQIRALFDSYAITTQAEKKAVGGNVFNELRAKSAEWKKYTKSVKGGEDTKKTQQKSR